MIDACTMRVDTDTVTSANPSIFWDISAPLSYNALFNFIIGMRGNGKTYGCKKHCIKRFIKNGEQFIYLRRYKDETKKVCKKFFDDIRNEFADNELAVKGNNFIIDGKIAGFAQSLSTSKIEKSNPFPNVTTIIFDEFIIDKGVYHYLSDEVIYFLEFYSTVARLRDVRVWFLSNAISSVNPYFTYFNIVTPNNKTGICKKNDILIQVTKNYELENRVKNSRFGRIIQNTRYAEYAIDNEFYRDNYTFVEKRTQNSEYYCTLIYDGKEIGVWVDYEQGIMCMSKHVDKTFPARYTITQNDHSTNTLLLAGRTKPQKIKNISLQYQLGNMRFESLQIKDAGLKILQIIGGW